MQGNHAAFFVLALRRANELLHALMGNAEQLRRVRFGEGDPYVLLFEYHLKSGVAVIPCTRMLATTTVSTRSTV